MLGISLLISYLTGALRLAFLILGICCMIKYLRS